MAEHVPGPIATSTVGVQAPQTAAYLQLRVAVTQCSCGEIHAAISEDYMPGPEFWLGVKFAQLNKWAHLELPGFLDGGADLDG